MDVKKNYLLAIRFLDFCLAAYICTAAVEKLELFSSMDDDMNDVRDVQKIAWLEDVVDSIIQMEWMDVTRNTSQQQ